MIYATDLFYHTQQNSFTLNSDLAVVHFRYLTDFYLTDLVCKGVRDHVESYVLMCVCVGGTGHKG